MVPTHRRAALLAALAVSLSAGAQDPERGRLLYETHCGECHYERLHRREHTTIHSLADLRAAVARWAPQTRHRFTPDDLEDVVQHLDAAHYKLTQAGRSPPPRGAP